MNATLTLVESLRQKELASAPRTDFEDGEARIRDTDYAKLLVFSEPIDIRKLIRRHSEALGVVATVAITSGEFGGRPGTEYWLTEEQCLYLGAKSEAPKAIEQTKCAFASVVAARRGELPAELLSDPIIQLRLSQIKTERALEEMRTQQAVIEKEQVRQSLLLEGHIPDFYTALGYLKRVKRRDIHEQPFGKIASAIVREWGDLSLKRIVPDAKYGEIGYYHERALDAALARWDEE